MRKFLLLTVSLLTLAAIKSQAQSCFNVSAGNDTTISCLQACLDIKARIPDIRTSDDYQVVSIPYAPYEYVTPGGNELTDLYVDDRFSNLIDLPFTFCFYGQNYTQITAGSNGVLTFDVATNANTVQGYHLNPGDRLPYAGGSPNTLETFYAPRASIFLAYYDMDPTTAASPRRKIEWRLEGTAPCRKLVISYYELDYYLFSSCNGLGLTCTMQAVLYEGTGLIDVFYATKPVCMGYQSGLAIAGLQNWNQDLAVTPPGKNGEVWNAVNEGIRYIPNGTGSLFNRVELYKNNVLISTGTTVNLGNGELEATFPNICQAEDSMSYVVRAFYQSCHNPAIETEGSDTIIVYKTLNPLDITITPAPCASSGGGTITVTDPVGANIEYSIDGGGSWQASPVFNVPVGNYTVIARVVGSLCTGSEPAIVAGPQPFTTNAAVNNILCNGQNNGQVTFNPAGPGSPFTYSNNAGVTYQVSNIFSGLAAGSHTFRIRNNAGCTQDTTVIITQPTALTASASATQATCNGNDGSIDVTVGGGTPGYQYSIDGGVSWQTSNLFTGLVSGNYNNIRVRDANGCFRNTSAFVPLNDTMRLELGPDSTICSGQSVILQPQTNAQTNEFKWVPATWLDYDTAKNPIATPQDTIRYTLTAKWGVCQRTDFITINVKRKPIANAGLDTTICYKTSAVLNGTANNLSGTVNYIWTPLQFVNPDSTAITTATPDTTQQFILTVTDNYGCNFAVTDSMMVFMQPIVPAFAGNDTIAVKGKPHQLTATGGVQYLWSPAGPLNNANIQRPMATLYNDTYFKVLVTDAFGCFKEDDIFVKVYEGPNYYVPNAFTPNGDGLNDVFRPIPVGMSVTDYFRVFNRYGEIVFETKEWMKGWDGTYKGKKALAGTYVWIVKGIDRNGRVVAEQGTVILIQ